MREIRLTEEIYAIKNAIAFDNFYYYLGARQRRFLINRRRARLPRRK